MPVINVMTHETELIPAAEALAGALSLPFGETAADFSLLLTPEHLSLKDNHATSKPLVIDFLSTQMRRRGQQAGLKRESLARALGLKKQTQPRIIDATAGLGRDSFILACLGFRVTLLERSPIIHAILADGLRRARTDLSIGPIVERMELIQTNALTWLAALPKSALPELIYLDPMFPERQKSALVKKDMQIFHALMGEDTDADQLLTLALTCATQRVVVKRPRLANYVANRTPSFSQDGSSCRFDIYLI
jgi:16S rRNA (guanine1516-N2)-methyltransferase